MKLKRSRLALCRLLCLTLAPSAFGASPRPEPRAERAQAFERAAAEQAAGRRAEAARLLRETATRFSSVHALLQLARLQAGDGEAKAALETLAQAGVLAPNSEDVLFATAQVALSARRPLPASVALQTLVRFAPEQAQYHYLLGVAMMQAGDMPAACEPLKQAEQLEPRRALTLIALGLALNSRKLFAEATPYLQRSLELEPESLEAMGALAEAEEGLGELDSAAARAERVLARDGKQAMANLVMGMVLMKRGQYGEARLALQRAIDSDPALTKAYYQLSLADARLGDEPASQRHLAAYRQRLAEIEGLLKEMRTQGVSSSEGSHP